MAHIEIQYAQNNEVVIAGIPFVVSGGVEENIVNIFGRKVNQGEPGPDDHPVNSTWIQESWVGGGQKYKMNAAADINRFDWSTCETEYPQGIVPAPLNYTYDVGGSVQWVHGDYNGKMYASGDAVLKQYNIGTDNYTVVGTMSSTPVGKGTAYRIATGPNKGKVWLFIPMGGAHDYLNDVGVITNVPTESAIDFEEWNGKLFKMATDGEIQFTIDGTTWQDIGIDGTRIPDDSLPRHLTSYYDRGGAPALTVVTSKSVYFLDFDGEVLHRAFSFPKHPHQGKGSAEWRGDLFVSVGLGVHQYNGGLVTPRGLDRDYGIPAEFDGGHIVDLFGSYNALYALVRGVATSELEEEGGTMQLGMGDDQLYLSSTTSYNLLMKWNGVGWHYVWHQDGGAPTSVTVSEADGKYNLWFAASDYVRRIPLSIGYYNPLSPPDTDRRRMNTHHETGWYDWGWRGQPKVAKAVEVYVPLVRGDAFLEIFYKLDHDANTWIKLGEVHDVGEHEFRMGPDTEGLLMPDGSPVYRGEVHERIKLRFFFRSDDVADWVALSWHALIGRRFLRPLRQWRFSLDLDATYKAYPNRNLKSELAYLANYRGAVTFVHRDDTFLVDVVGVTGPEETGENFGSMKQVSLSEAFEMGATDHLHAD